MKKFIIIVVIIFLCLIGYIAYVELDLKKEPEIVLQAEPEKTQITEYYIYGTSLNIKGSLEVENISFDEIDLILYNKDIKIEKEETIEKRITKIPIKYEQNVNKMNFYLSDTINDGLILDNIKKGNYTLFIRTKKTNTDENQESETIYKYYSLNNLTEYKETTYYTLSKYNNKIVINSNNEYQTMMFNITENKNKEIYDIVIDAGHGGIDPGAVVNGHKETDFTLTLATKLKEKLEQKGIKVKLTRDENTLAKDEWFDEYGKGGRAQISHEVSAKYLLSFHLNSNQSSNVNGVEIYTANNINYDFAKSIIESIVNNTSINYSNLKTHKMFNGIYTHNFNEYEIEKSKNDATKKGWTPYDITTDSAYLYMIRETGGIMTGAYVDDRNKEEQPANDYYKSNVGTEAYLLETCYISNKQDVDIIINEQDKYIEAISEAISDKILK